MASNSQSRGSVMSRKQLEASVIKGQELTAVFSGGETETGFLAGMDDYHLLFVVPARQSPDQVETALLNKGSVERLWLGSCNYEEHPLHREMEPIVSPFRESISRRNTTT